MVGFLLAQIFNFLVLFVALTVLAWRPLIRSWKHAARRIAKGLEDARAAEQARANAEREAQKLIDQRRAEANKLVEEGRSRGEEQARTVVADAQREAETIRSRGTRLTPKRNAMRCSAKSVRRWRSLPSPPPSV